MPRYIHCKLIFLVTLFFCQNTFAEPKRIATLAPHLTEWVYSLGKGNEIVAVSAYSDYPEQAKKHPIIADVNGINLTKLVELNPDLVLVWQSNAKLGQIEKMEKLGLKVFISNPHTLEDINTEVSAIGELLGQSSVAKQYISEFENNISTLRTQYAKEKLTPTFFQLWHTPLMTANRNTMINQILNLCGLVNVFAQSDINYPTVTKEQVMLKQPEYIIISEMENSDVQTKIWQSLTQIPAVKKEQIINLNPDHLHRYTNRVLIAANELCEKVNE